MGRQMQIGKELGRRHRRLRGVRLLRVRRAAEGQNIHQQLHRGLQQADSEDAQEAHTVRHGGGHGEMPRFHIPPLQPKARQEADQGQRASCGRVAGGLRWNADTRNPVYTKFRAVSHGFYVYKNLPICKEKRSNTNRIKPMLLKWPPVSILIQANTLK